MRITGLTPMSTRLARRSISLPTLRFLAASRPVSRQTALAKTRGFSYRPLGTASTDRPTKALETAYSSTTARWERTSSDSTTPEDFAGKSLEGCNDNLVLTRPDNIAADSEKDSWIA